MIYLRLFYEFAKTGLFAVGGLFHFYMQFLKKLVGLQQQILET